MEAGKEANAFLGMTLLGQTGPVQAGPQPFQRVVDDYFRIDAARLRALTGGMVPLPANATPQQQEAAALQLYQRLVADRQGGIAYEASGNRMPKTPAEVLRQPMRADCDELAALFIAAARVLNINTSGMSLGRFDIHTNQAGVNAREPHAALYVRGLNGHNYIMDFTFPNGPWQVRDFNPQTISAQYRGLTISRGTLAGHSIISTTVTGEAATLRDIAADGLIDRATRMGDTLGAPPIAAQRIAAVMDVLALAAKAATSDQLRVRIAEMYAELGEAARTNGHTATATRAFTAGNSVIIGLPAKVQQANTHTAYKLGVGMANILERNRTTRAQAQQIYQRMIRIEPSRQAAYDGAYRIGKADLDADIAAGRTADAQRRINELVDLLRTGIRSSGSDVSMMTVLQGNLDEVIELARIKGFSVPAPRTP